MHRSFPPLVTVGVVLATAGGWGCSPRPSTKAGIDPSPDQTAATHRLIPPDQLEATNKLSIEIGINRLPAGMNWTSENLLINGKAVAREGGMRLPKALRINGIYEPTGARAVQLNVSPGTVCDLQQLRTRIGAESSIRLVDSAGGSHQPIGYLFKWQDVVEIVLSPADPIDSIQELPMFQSSDEPRLLKLVFFVPVGTTITEFRAGATLVARTDLPVSDVH